MNIILANLIGIIALIVSLLIFQAKNYHKMIIRQIIYSILMILEYLLLGAYIALFASLIALIRSILFLFLKKVPRFILFILIFIMILVHKYTYADIFSLIPLTIFILVTLNLQTKKILKFKIYSIFFSILWIIYNLHVKAYVAALSSFLDIISIIYALKNN